MDTLDVKSDISEVTLYMDRALITRSANLKLEKGVLDAVVSPLPAILDRQTLRAKGVGSAKVKILGVEYDTFYRGEADDENVKSLEEKLEKLKDQLRLLNEQKTLLQTEQAQIAELRIKTMSELARGFGKGKMGVADAEQLLKFLHTENERLLKEIIDQEAKIRELNREIKVVDDEYQKLTYEGKEEYSRAVVSIEAESAGDFTLFLEYTIVNCGWYPSYDLRYDEETKVIILTYYGVLSQNTGEDWADVDLSLSTYKPHLGATPSRLQPWYLNFYHRPPSPKTSMKRMKKMESMDMTAGAEVPTEMEKVRDEEYVEEEKIVSEYSTAEVASVGVSTVFHLPRRVDIPPDGTDHREPIGDFPFEGEVDYLIQPAIEDRAYIRVKVENTSDVFLLSGQMNIFRGGDYIGSGSLEQVAPGEEFETYLGVDERLKVKRSVDRLDKDEAGIVKKSNRKLREVRVELENTTDDEINVEVLEAIPIPTNEDIKVKVKDIDPEESEIDDENLLHWEIALKPKEKRELTLRYEVEYPADKIIEGI